MDMKRSFAITSSLFLFCALAAAQDAPQARSYPVSGHGSVKVLVPADWTEHVKNGEAGMPPTIELTAQGGDVMLLITPLWSPKGDPRFNSAQNIRTAIERSAKSVQHTAVEKELVIRAIGTVDGRGYFFWATDRAPKAGEYEFMANGGVPAGKLLLSFTVLSHAEPPKGIEEALEIVKSASNVP
jgi:hypothetical protein